MKWSSTTCRGDAIIILIFFYYLHVRIQSCLFDQTQKPFLIKLDWSVWCSEGRSHITSVLAEHREAAER